MFFNEDLYLEGDEPIKVDEPMKEEEIAEACKDCKAEGLDNVIGEGAGFYTYALEQLEVLNEGYYNLREKMMNVEHVAALKAKDGLFSESEQILSESLEGFTGSLKNFFVKVGNTIKNLFNRFVEFIMGHVVSVKKISQMNSGQAWDLYFKKLKDGKLEKIKIFNYKSDEIIGIVGKTNNILSELNKFITTLGAEVGSASVSSQDDFGSRDTYKWLGYKKGIIAKANQLNDLGKYIAAGFLQASENEAKYGLDPSKTKSETELNKQLFEDRFKYVEGYKRSLDAVKANKSVADKIVSNGIKGVNNLQKTKDSNINKNRSRVITEMRWCGVVTSKTFSKITSVMSDYYSESLKIVRRVVGAQAAADVKSNIKKLGEGFDYEAYFNEAFN